nr:polysaccharide pyruvyl transferase family protein [uncultured Methanoregula sp.]
MKIELRNVGFVNKGSELMLHAILQRVSREWADTDFVMVADCNKAPYIKRAQLGFFQKPWYNLLGRIPLHEVVRLIPSSVRNSFGLVLDSELHVVLDASGFSYSDQWDKGSTITLSKAITRWKHYNIKVILLPQAFGPFTSKDLIHAMKIVADHADLIYARDPISYAYLIDTVGKRSNIKMAPDFTNLLTGIIPQDFNVEKNKFCIIPNYRMIDKTSSQISTSYLPFLTTCIHYLQENETTPFILIHEGENDIKLAQKIVQSLDEKIEIIKETDPFKIKGILGACEGSLSSRFHGLVSSLSQGVPTLGTSWSHKYQMLFESYDCNECMFNSLSDKEEIFNKIDLVIKEPSKSKIRKKITVCAANQKQMTEIMWDEVFDVIVK